MFCLRRNQGRRVWINVDRAMERLNLEPHGADVAVGSKYAHLSGCRYKDERQPDSLSRYEICIYVSNAIPPVPRSLP